MVMDYKQRFLGCHTYAIKTTKFNICKALWTLPRCIVSKTTDLEMLPLRGPPKKKGNKTTNIGIVDGAYVVHRGLPTLGVSAVEQVQKELVELNKFKERWKS